MSDEKLLARYEHCEKRAEQLEEKWENGERMRLFPAGLCAPRGQDV